MLLIGIVAELLGDRDQPDAVLGEAADVELELELVAEEAAEAVDQDHVEHRRLGGRRVDHALEFRPPIVGRGCAGLDIVGDDLPAARRAISLGLAALVRDGEIVVGLPSGRDSQVEGSTNRHRHGDLQGERVNGGLKQFVEQIAEPGLEHLDLGLGYRRPPRPSSVTVQVVVSSGAAGRPTRRAGGRRSHRGRREDASCAATFRVRDLRLRAVTAVSSRRCAKKMAERIRSSLRSPCELDWSRVRSTLPTCLKSPRRAGDFLRP